MENNELNIDILEVVALPTERDAKGLSAKVKAAVETFLRENKGTLVGYDLSGTKLDDHGSPQNPTALFGRTLVLLRWQGSGKRK